MYWRAIVRISLNKDSNSALRNAVAATLTKAGFERTKTGTWEIETSDEAALLRAIRTATRQVQDPTRVSGVSKNVVLDHLWVYIDRRAGNPNQVMEL